MNAYILASYRTAVGKAKKGGFRFTRPDELASVVIKHLLASVPQLDPARIDDLIVGNAVPEAEQGLQIARWIAVQSLPVSVPALTINRYCASGLEAIAMATAKIASGQAECIIAGGAESMSLVPTVGWKTVPSYNIAKEHSDYFLGMGLTAEEVATKYNVTREDQDAFSFSSHQKASAAIVEGKFKSEIVPVEVEEVVVVNNKRISKKNIVDTDEGPRADTSMDALSKLKPAFRSDGTVTAGNSSQTSDGAAFVIVMSERMMKELNLSPVARLVSCASAGVDPRIMGIGPVEAIPKALKQAGLSLNDIDLIELNEAFAAQALAVTRDLGLPDFAEHVNPNGGAIALGHPLGASGVRLVTTAVSQLHAIGARYALCTMCVGVGQGVALILERV